MTVGATQYLDPAERANSFCMNAERLDLFRFDPIADNHIAALALFIETKLREAAPQETTYFSRDITGLKRAIVHDPKNDRTFIILMPKRHLLHGADRSVGQAILYDPQEPERVAHVKPKKTTKVVTITDCQTSETKVFQYNKQL